MSKWCEAQGLNYSSASRPQDLAVEPAMLKAMSKSNI